MAFFCEKKVKVQVYSLISNISSDFYIFTPWSLDLFIRVPSQLHGEHSPAAISAQQTIIHISIFVLPVKWNIRGLSDLLKDTTLKQCPYIERGEI